MGYLKLLIVQFGRGGISSDIKEIGLISAGARKHWKKRIAAKFPKQKEDGTLYNEVMDGIRTEAIIAYNTSVENGKKGGRPKKPNPKPAGYPLGNPTLNPQGNPDETQAQRQPETNNHLKEKTKKENWIQYPTAETPLQITDSELQLAVEFVCRITQKLLSLERARDFWEAFRLNLNGKFYADRGDLLQHFRNWLKDRDLSETDETSYLKTGETALERHNRELREKIIG